MVAFESIFNQQRCFPNNPRIFMFWGWFVVLASCSSSDISSRFNPLPPIHPAAQRHLRANRITDKYELLKGPLAKGLLGDFVLGNRKVTIIVRSLGGLRGGSIIDAGLENGANTLEGFLTVFGTKTLHLPRYHRLHLERWGSSAGIRVVGYDSQNSNLEIQTQYSLTHGFPIVQITTKITNIGTTTIKDYKATDYINWDDTITTFAPDIGYLPEGKQFLPWLSAWSNEVAYAYTKNGKTTPFEIALGKAKVKLIASNIAPNQTITIKRNLIIGTGNKMADLIPFLLKAHGQKHIPVSIAVVDQIGEPLKKATVHIFKQEKIWGVVQTLDDGRIDLRLPKGSFNLWAYSRGRATDLVPINIQNEKANWRNEPIIPNPIEQDRFIIQGASEEPPEQPFSAVRRHRSEQRSRMERAESRGFGITLRTGPPSQMVFEIRDADSSDPLPCKITVIGINKTHTPWLGSLFSKESANTILSYTGRGVLPLPPGEYSVIVSHGPTYSIHEQKIILPPHTGASLIAKLKQVMNITDYVPVDCFLKKQSTKLHEIPIPNRKLANLVEGVSTFQLAIPDDFSALMNGKSPNSLEQNFKHWLKNLQRGIQIPSVASFGHFAIAGGKIGLPRTYVGVGKKHEDSYDPNELFEIIDQGNTVASSGPFLQLLVDGKGPGKTVRLSKPTTVKVDVTVYAPAWMSVGPLVLFVNGNPYGEPIAIPDLIDGERIKKTFFVTIRKDSFIVARTLLPNTLPPNYGRIPPIAITGPVWIDTSGNGRYDP